MRVKFNIVLSWAIFSRSNDMKRAIVTLFSFRFLSRKVLYNVFTRNILKTVRGHVKVYIKFLSLETLSQ